MLIKTYEEEYNWYVTVEKSNDYNCYAKIYKYVYSTYGNKPPVKSFELKDNDFCDYTERLEEAMCKAVLVVCARGVWQEELQTADCDCFDVDEFLELAGVVEKVRELCRAEIIKTCPNAKTY